MRTTFAPWSMAVWLTCLALARPSGAQPPEDRFSLDWQRDEGAQACVSGESLQRMIEQTTGSTLTSASNITIRGLVRRQTEPTRWSASITIVSDDGQVLGERQLQQASPLCASLTPSIVLVLAMVVAPNFAARALPPSVLAEITEQGRREAAAVAAASSALPANLAEDRPRRAPSQVRLISHGVATRPLPAGQRGPSFAAELSLGVGLLPKSTLGLSIGLGLPLWQRWQLAVSATYWEKTSVAVPGPRSLGGGVTFQAGALDLALCRSMARIGRVTASACGGAALAYRATEAAALAYRNDGSKFYVAPTGILAIDFEFARRWFVVSHLGITTLLPRHRYIYTDAQGGSHSLFAPAPIAGWLSLGMAKEL